MTINWSNLTTKSTKIGIYQIIMMKPLYYFYLYLFYLTGDVVLQDLNLKESALVSISILTVDLMFCKPFTMESLEFNGDNFS